MVVRLTYYWQSHSLSEVLPPIGSPIGSASGSTSVVILAIVPEGQ